MAKTARKNKRRRRGRFAALRKLLSLLLICAAIVAALVLFFKVETITVEGNQRYSDQEVIEACGIQPGDNMLLLNKYELSSSIYSKLSYVGAVQISRSFPSTLKIQVEECSVAAAIVTMDGTWLCSSQGKLLEQASGSLPENCPRVEGCTLLLPAAGEKLAMPEADRLRQTRLLELLQALEKENMLPLIRQIRMGGSSRITLTYEERFAGYLPWDGDMEYLVRYLAAVVDKLEANETGIIDLTQPGEAHFIPE